LILFLFSVLFWQPISWLTIPCESFKLIFPKASVALTLVFVALTLVSSLYLELSSTSTPMPSRLERYTSFMSTSTPAGKILDKGAHWNSLLATTFSKSSVNLWVNESPLFLNFPYKGFPCTFRIYNEINILYKNLRLITIHIYITHTNCFFSHHSSLASALLLALSHLRPISLPNSLYQTCHSLMRLSNLFLNFIL